MQAQLAGLQHIDARRGRASYYGMSGDIVPEMKNRSRSALPAFRDRLGISAPAVIPPRRESG